MMASLGVVHGAWDVVGDVIDVAISVVEGVPLAWQPTNIRQINNKIMQRNKSFFVLYILVSLEEVVFYDFVLN